MEAPDVPLDPDSEHAAARAKRGVEAEEQKQVQRWVIVVAVIFLIIVSLAAGAAGHKIIRDKYFPPEPACNQTAYPISECAECAQAIANFMQFNATQ